MIEKLDTCILTSFLQRELVTIAIKCYAVDKFLGFVLELLVVGLKKPAQKYGTSGIDFIRR